MAETVDPVVGMVEAEGGMGVFLTAFANWTSCFQPSSSLQSASLNSLGDSLQSSDGMVNRGSSAFRGAQQDGSSSRRWGTTRPGNKKRGPIAGEWFIRKMGCHT